MLKSVAPVPAFPSPLSPFHLLKADRQQPHHSTAGSPAARDALDRDDGRGLSCAQCGLPITRSRDRIAVGGRHEHTCLNPHGFVYHIGCFADASGLSPRGAPSTEWSWFPGHAWQTVQCSSCSLHLGWQFRGPEGAFFGLILVRLREED